MKKVLLIDDNEGDLILIEEAIIDSGFECEVFRERTGEDGVERAKESSPDIVVVDTRLPGIDGFETCRMIKEALGEKTKIVVMTGIIDEINSIKAKEMGADDYAVKAGNFSELAACIAGFK